MVANRAAKFQAHPSRSILPAAAGGPDSNDTAPATVVTEAYHGGTLNLVHLASLVEGTLEGLDLVPQEPQIHLNFLFAVVFRP